MEEKEVVKLLYEDSAAFTDEHDCDEEEDFQNNEYLELYDLDLPPAVECGPDIPEVLPPVDDSPEKTMAQNFMIRREL
eukprot:2638972-Karenia_brevis.AAC.1